jgi:SMI1 / KNR4 family (SUKH-1)
MSNANDLFRNICRRLSGSVGYSHTDVDFDAVEQELGVTIPAAFKKFWSESVVYGPPGFILFRPNTSPGEIVDQNKTLRNEDGLPNELIVFAKSGDEDWWLLDLRNADESPVICCDADSCSVATEAEVDSESFDAFIRNYSEFLVNREIKMFERFREQLA